MKYLPERVFFLFFVVFALTVFPASVTRASEVDPTQRVRIAECFNSPPSGILFLQVNDVFLGLADAPPVWQTLVAKTKAERQNLERASVVGAYDMVITSDEGYVESLRKQGLLRRVAPIYAEHLLLVGPPELSSKKKELSVKATMKKIFEDEDLFFSSLDNTWVSGEEKKLWTQAGVARPYDNKNYVESGHDDIGLLIQAEDERGFALTGEASFAQYLDMQRYDTPLIVYADTAVIRTTHVCLIVNSGYRKARTEMADRYVDWLKSEAGAALIDSFSLGTIAPFRAVKE